MADFRVPARIHRLRHEAVVDVALLGTIRKSGGLAAVGELAAGEVPVA